MEFIIFIIFLICDFYPNKKRLFIYATKWWGNQRKPPQKNLIKIRILSLRHRHLAWVDRLNCPDHEATRYT